MSKDWEWFLCEHNQKDLQTPETADQELSKCFKRPHPGLEGGLVLVVSAPTLWVEALSPNPIATKKECIPVNPRWKIITLPYSHLYIILFSCTEALAFSCNDVWTVIKPRLTCGDYNYKRNLWARVTVESVPGLKRQWHSKFLLVVWYLHSIWDTLAYIPSTMKK
jgi:hypothetical protein